MHIFQNNPFPFTSLIHMEGICMFTIKTTDKNDPIFNGSAMKRKVYLMEREGME